MTHLSANCLDNCGFQWVERMTPHMVGYGRYMDVSFNSQHMYWLKEKPKGFLHQIWMGCTFGLVGWLLDIWLRCWYSRHNNKALYKHTKLKIFYTEGSFDYKPSALNSVSNASTTTPVWRVCPRHRNDDVMCVTRPLRLRWLQVCVGPHLHERPPYLAFNKYDISGLFCGVGAWIKTSADSPGGW